MVDEPHNVSGVPRSRICGSCDHYFALPVVPYRLLHPSFTARNAAATATAGDPTSATTPTTPATAARASATTATVRGAARQAGDGAGDGTPAHGRCTGARCTLVLCVLGDLRVASGCASECEPRVLRVLRVPHVFVLVPLGLPVEVGCMFHACSVFCSTQSKRSRRRSRPRQWIHRRSRRQPRKRALGR